MRAASRTVIYYTTNLLCHSWDGGRGGRQERETAALDLDDLDNPRRPHLRDRPGQRPGLLLCNLAQTSVSLAGSDSKASKSDSEEAGAENASCRQLS